MNKGPYFFRQHQGIFIKLIDLSTIIPKLLSKELLTDDEYQTVTLKTEIENERKRNLSDILYKKPPWVPWIVLECLQDLEEPIPNHIVLADKLKCYLDQQWPEISKLSCSSQIQHIHSALCQRNITLDHITRTLKDIFVEGKMQIQIPISIGDFPSLILFLHKSGLCNDLDTDLLCKLLVEIGADDLKEHLKTFFDAHSDDYIDTLDPVEPPSEFFLAHTFHSSPRVTHMQLFNIKDIFAHFLKIPRYSFSCTACKMEDESTILVWQFPVHVCNYLQATYDSNSVFKETLSKVCLQDIKDDAAIRQRKRQRSVEGSSTNNECETGTAIKVPKLCDSRQESSSSSSTTQQSTSLSSITSTERDNFIENLKATYMDTNFFKRSAGPFFGKSIHFINLALIKKQGASDDDKLRDKFLKDSLHGLVEDIMKKKVQIGKHEIFSYGSDSRKLVLVEGSPGVGKTMLAMKLCQDWAKGEILAEYDMVILVTLRRFRNRNSLQTKDLIGIYSEGEFAENMAQKLLKCGGARTLIILEGWDELPPVLREEMSFFSDLILANKLPKASIMVTSRPTVSGTLYDYMDERHIEVLGFKPKQITEYIQCHCSPKKANLICTHLQRFPNLKALAHIPLTLSIICKVIRDEDILPSTLTELYNKYICQKVYQAVKKKENESLTGLNSIEELKDEEMKTIIKKLCEVALDGLVDKCYVFNSEDLRCTVHGSFDGYGLLNVIHNPANAGCKLLYQFIHLSVQEFLAAYHIQELPNHKRLELLKNYREDKQFQNVWKFLAGITKLEDREFQDTIIYNTNRSNKSQLFLIHCLYEAHNSEICSIAARELQWTLNLNNMSLNTTDCLCAAYAVTSAGGTWTIDLRACNIGEDGLEIFKQHLVSWKSDNHESTDFSIKEFNLVHNHITIDACRHLADILRHNVHIAELYLASNKFGDEGVKELCDVLSENKTVSVLQFLECGLTSLSGRALAEMLKVNTAMKELFVIFEKLGDDGVIPLAKVVAVNKTLNEITLSDTQITIKSLKEFQKSLNVNNTFKVIRLDRNELTVPEARIVANMISETSSLETIDMSKNPIGDEGFGVIMDALIAKPSGSLENIGFYGCGITSKGLPKLVECFQVTKTFKKIQLGGNKLGDEGAEYIIEAVTKNESQSIISIRLVGTKMSRAAEKKLEELHKSVGHSELDINFKSVGYFGYKYSQDKKTSTSVSFCAL